MSKMIKTIALGAIFAVSGFVGAEELSSPVPGEPWEFNTKFIQKKSNWELGYFDSNDHLRRKSEEPRVWMTKLGKDVMKKRIEDNNFVVGSDEAEVTKELISLVNKFNKLEGSKAITKVEVESRHGFQLEHAPHESTAESEKLKFFEFIKLKHVPIVLETVGRNETDSKKQRDRCTMLVTYEESAAVEVEGEKSEALKGGVGTSKSVEEKPKKKILKTNYYYLDESQGSISEQHLYKADGTWDRMESR
jgi:hypothetical protein